MVIRLLAVLKFSDEFVRRQTAEKIKTRHKKQSKQQHCNVIQFPVPNEVFLHNQTTSYSLDSLHNPCSWVVYFANQLVDQYDSVHSLQEIDCAKCLSHCDCCIVLVVSPLQRRCLTMTAGISGWPSTYSRHYALGSTFWLGGGPFLT